MASYSFGWIYADRASNFFITVHRLLFTVGTHGDRGVLGPRQMTAPSQPRTPDHSSRTFQVRTPGYRKLDLSAIALATAEAAATLRAAFFCVAWQRTRRTVGYWLSAIRGEAPAALALELPLV
jgi:hypothetical protein